MENPKGESDRRPLRPIFDRRLKLEFHGSRVNQTGANLIARMSHLGQERTFGDTTRRVCSWR